MRAAAGFLGLLLVAALPAHAQEKKPAPILQETSEVFGAWRLYCQVWSAPQRLECEALTRQSAGANRVGALAWYRSSTRWLDGLRFRLDGTGIDQSKGVRVWIDTGLFRPEFPCKPFELEPNTCAVTDPAVNEALVRRLSAGKETVSAVGYSATGEKIEIFFSIKGFKDMVQRMDEVRAKAGIPFQ